MDTKLAYLYSISKRIAHIYLQTFGFESLYHAEPLAPKSHKKRHLATGYKLMMNIFFITTALYVAAVSGPALKVYTNNNLTKVFNALNPTLRVGVLLYTILRQNALRWNFQKYSSDFHAVKRQYFQRRVEQLKFDSRRFSGIILLKFLIACCQPCSVIFGVVQVIQGRSLLVTLILVYYTLTNFTMLFISYQYTYAVWELGECFTILNADTQRLLQQLAEFRENTTMRYKRLLGNLAAADLHCIANVQRQLTSLLVTLNHSFQVQVIIVLLAFMMYNVLFGYYSFLFVDGESLGNEVNVLNTLCGGSSYVVIFYDLYFFYWICDATKVMHQSSITTLREFDDYAVVDGELRRQCDMYFVQFALQKPFERIAGMFSIDKGAFLAFLAFIIMKTIILVQFDFENRMRKAQGKETL